MKASFRKAFPVAGKASAIFLNIGTGAVVLFTFGFAAMPYMLDSASMYYGAGAKSTAWSVAIKRMHEEDLEIDTCDHFRPYDRRQKYQAVMAEVFGEYGLEYKVPEDLTREEFDAKMIEIGCGEKLKGASL